MAILIAVVFVTVFSLIAVVMIATNRSNATKHTRDRLTSVLRRAGSADEEVIDIRKDNSLSAVPWIDQLLSKIQVSAQLHLLLTQADLPWTPGRLLLSSGAAWVIAGYALYALTPAGALAPLFALLVGVVPFAYVWRKRQRRMQDFQRRLPDTLDLMVSALRAGHSIAGAWGSVANESPEPIRREFRLCYEEQNYGVDMRTATDNLIRRVPVQDLRIVITALLIHKESGGNVAEVLEKTAYVIRDRFRLRDQIKVFTAQGRVTGAILTAVPVALGFALSLVNPSYVKLLFERPLGRTMVAVAVVLNLLGLLVIRKIIRIKV